MPGVMDTILYCGLNPELIASSRSDLQEQLWQAYAQFIGNFATSRHALPLDIPRASNAGFSSANELPNWKTWCDWLLKNFEQHTRRPFPIDPWTCLRESIEAVWQSWKNPRATAYRRMLAIADDAGLTAVTVQVMADVGAAGVLFTQAPQGPHRDSIVVEATTGSAQRLVTGQLTPYRYIIQRPNQGIEVATTAVSVEAPDPQTAAPLDVSQVRELAKIGMELEREFATPLDIEWGLNDAGWIFFQARPIAGDQLRQRMQQLRTAQVGRLKQISQGRPCTWVRHQLAETLPAPTPLTWHVVRRFMSGSGGFGKLYRQLGYSPSKRVCEEGFLELIGGQVYADLERVSELFARGWPWSYDLDALRKNTSALEQAPSVFDERRVNETFLLRLPHLIWVGCRAHWKIKRLAKGARDSFESGALPGIREYVQRERERNLSSCGQELLLRIFDERCRRVLDECGPATLLPGLFGGLAYSTLEHELIALLGIQEGRQLANDLVSGLESDHITQRDEMLWHIARGEIPLDRFLDEYGHRAVHEMELSAPRWREDPRTVQQLIDWLRLSTAESPEQQRERARQRRVRRVAELENTLAAAGGRSFYPRIAELVWYASEMLPYREIGKNYFMLGYELIRQVLCEIARRQNWDDEIFFCHPDELARLDSQSNAALQCTLDERRREWQLAQRLSFPEVIESKKLDQLETEAPSDFHAEIVKHADRSLKATVLSAGSARGPAFVVSDSQKAPMPRGGYILICNSLDPGLTPLLAAAKGLVVERGGALSHGAVVARQLGVPALGCPEATRLIRSGDWLVLDSEQGLLHIERKNDECIV
jgi:pyruvate,water dikinase